VYECIDYFVAPCRTNISPAVSLSKKKGAVIGRAAAYRPLKKLNQVCDPSRDEARQIAANVAKPAGAFAQRQFQMITMLGRSHEWAREASSLCPALSCVLHCGGWAVELANADD
jgi:hypothetical protein